MGQLPGGDASPLTFQPPGLPTHLPPPWRYRGRGRRGHRDVLEVGVRVSEDGRPFSRLCLMPVPPRQDPTRPRMPGVRVQVPSPGSWGPTFRTEVVITPASCLLSPSSGRSPSSNMADRGCPARGWEAPPSGISSFQEAFDLSPPSLWVIFSPEIPPRKPHGTFFPPPPAVINPMLTQPTSSS